MKLVAPTAHPVRVAPVHANAGVGAWYARELKKHVDAMAKSVEFWVKQLYESEVVPTLAQDSPTSKIQRKLDQLAVQWEGTFDRTSRVTSQAFANKVLRHNNTAFKAALDKSGFSVQMRMTPAIQDRLDGIVDENVKLIKSIPQEYLEHVRQQVMESVEKGRAMKEVTHLLREVYGITARRAAFIVRDQNNKATAGIHRTRQHEFGITKARWIHSAGSVHPREEHEQWDAENATYDIVDGMWSEEDGEYVWPGTPCNCGCVSESIIEGYNDQPEEEENAA